MWRVNGEKKDDRVDPIVGGGERMVKDAFADDADIRVMIRRMEELRKAGMEPQKDGFYGDVSEFGDLRASLERVHEANEKFMKLDANVRKAANNRPEEMLDMLTTQEGREALQRAGMDLGLELAPETVTEPVTNSPSKRVETPSAAEPTGNERSE